MAWVISGNGTVGAIYHTPFPVIARVSWGFWGSYVPILSRVILAVFWFAIQNVNGGNATHEMIGSIWPSFYKLGNHIPVNQGITSAGMISYLVFWILQFPFLCMRPDRLRWLFIAKSILVPIAFIAMLIWAFVAESGGGSIFKNQKASVSGPSYSWLFLANMTSVMGNYATLAVNQSDFSRYSKVSPKWQMMYIPMLPAFFTFISFIGIAASSAGQARYGGSVPWDPTQLIQHWSSRACRFFVAFAFTLASAGVNISANSLSAANDMTALSPSFINLKRGQVLCALLSWCLVPWRILESAERFLNFMNAYSIFLGPISAIMLWDFWILNRRKYDTLAMYHPDSIYRYTYGINFRAILAFVVGVVPNLPGFINSVNSTIPVGVGKHPYQFGWMLGFVGTSVVYVPVSLIWPPTEARVERAIKPDEVYDARSNMVEGIDSTTYGYGIGLDEPDAEKDGQSHEVVLEKDKTESGGYRGT